MSKDNLGKLDPAFEGFKLCNGQIVTPNGYACPPGYLYSIPIRMQLLAEYRRQLRTPEQWLL